MDQIPNARFRPRYAHRKVEDLAIFGGELLHPAGYDPTSEIEVSEQLPLKQEAILGLGDFLNRLVMKDQTSLYTGQTLSREDILAILNPFTHALEGQVLAPCTKKMVLDGMSITYPSLMDEGSGVDTDLATLVCGMYSDKGPADAPGNISSGPSSATPKNNVAQLFASGVSDQRLNLADYFLTPWIQNNPGSSSASPLPMMTDGQDANPTTLDFDVAMQYWALSYVHTSALSFIYQFRKELARLAGKTQYLSSELVGFFEKGLKGDFLRDQTVVETWLMIAFVELGKAIRTQRWTRNVRYTNSQSNASNSIIANGVVNPFYTELNAKSTHGGGQHSFAPWWVAPLVDREHYEYDETIDDVRDIHREDLFYGIKALLEAASLELGMGWKTLGNPYLDFFESMDDAKLPDLTDLSDVKAMRTMNMAGYTDMQQFHNREDPDAANMVMGFFSDLIQDGTISQSVRLDLQQDFEQLDNLPCITGNRFKEGAQLCGPFEHTSYHRKTRFGEHSLDTQYNPYVLMRPQSYVSGPGTYFDLHWVGVAGTNVWKSDFADQAAYDVGKAAAIAAPEDTLWEGYGIRTNGGTGILSAGSSSVTVSKDQTMWYDASAHTTRVEPDNDLTLYEVDVDQAGINATTTGRLIEWISWPSIDKGWSSIAKGMKHKSGHILRGYGTINRGATRVSSDDALSTQPYLLNTDAGDGFFAWADYGGVPTAPDDYWRVGHDGILPALIPVLNKVYQNWTGRTSGLFRRSELKNLLSFTTINLKREMKMNTPEAFFAKYGKEILGMMGCGATGFDPAFTMRHANMQLTDGFAHPRSADTRSLITPYAIEASGIEDVFAAQHLLGFLCGLYGPSAENMQSVAVLPQSSDTVVSDYIFGGDDAYSTISAGLLDYRNWFQGPNDGTSATDWESTAVMKFNTNVNEIKFMPLVCGPIVNPYLSGGVYNANATTNQGLWDHSEFLDRSCSLFRPIRASSFKTFYHTYKPSDGAITYVGVTPLGVNEAGLSDHWGNGWAMAQAQTYDLLTEEVGPYGYPSIATDADSGTLSVSGGTTAEVIAGQMDVFRLWRLDAVTGAHPRASPTYPNQNWNVPSLCTNFGTGSTPTLTSPVLGFDDLPTYAINTAFLGNTISDVIDAQNLEYTAVDDLVPWSPQQNASYLAYLEDRAGSINGTPLDVNVWRQHAPSLLMYDQDLLDTDEGMLGAVLWLGHRISHPGQITYLSTINADGTIGYEIRSSYSWGAGANVALDIGATPTGGDDYTAVSEV